MSQSAPGNSINAVLARLDRSSPEKLLASLAAELLRLDREMADMAARLLAMEQLQSTADRLLPTVGNNAGGELPKNLLIDATHSLLEQKCECSRIASALLHVSFHVSLRSTTERCCIISYPS